MIRTSHATRQCWSDSLELGISSGSVPVARARTRVLLAEWGLEELSDAAEQICSELAANAIEATRAAGLIQPPRLTLIAGLRTLVIAVWDPVPGHPAPGAPGPDAESGRGLIIVDALADAWDWKPARGGKTVRVLLRGKPRYA